MRCAVRCAQVEVEFEDCTLPFTVSPLLATLILHFTHREEWTDAQLAAGTGMELENLRRRMSFWVNQGVLLETSLPAGAGTLYTAPDRFGGREEGGSEGHGPGGESEEGPAAAGGVDEPRALQEVRTPHHLTASQALRLSASQPLSALWVVVCGLCGSRTWWGC